MEHRENYQQPKTNLFRGEVRSQSRGQAAELKQTANRQSTYAFAEYVSGQRASVPLPVSCHHHHLSRIPLGQSARESPGQKRKEEEKKLSNLQGLANKMKRDQGLTGPVSRPPPAPQRLPNHRQNLQMRTAPFWIIMRRVMVTPYRRFGTTYRFLL